MTQALPGWQAYITGSYPPEGPVSLAYFNVSDMDQMTIGVYNSLAPVYMPHPVLGQYTAYLEGDLGSATFGSASLSQTGLIPAAAKTIRFATTYSSTIPSLTPYFALLVNGTPIPFYQSGNSSGFTAWVGDISSFAGTSGTVKFEVQASYAASPTHWIFAVGIDSISFSSTPIPEPSAAAMLGLGWSWLALIRRGSRWTSPPRPRSVSRHLIPKVTPA